MLWSDGLKNATIWGDHDNVVSPFTCAVPIASFVGIMDLSLLNIEIYHISVSWLEIQAKGSYIFLVEDCRLSRDNLLCFSDLFWCKLKQAARRILLCHLVVKILCEGSDRLLPWDHVLWLSPTVLRKHWRSPNLYKPKGTVHLPHRLIDPLISSCPSKCDAWDTALDNGKVQIFHIFNIYINKFKTGWGRFVSVRFGF